jgi:hypothetical protein
MVMRWYTVLGIVLIFFSCGIEDYIFIPSVSSSDITVTLNSHASIRLPSMSGTEQMYFSHFAVYYRIYISGLSLAGTIDTGSFASVNSTLAADYNAFLPYINTTSTTINTSIGTLFSNRHYQTIALEDIDIDRDILNSGGKTIIFDFNQTIGVPQLQIGGGSFYNLRRSNGNGVFNPVPINRYFVNSSDLHSDENAISAINADVAANTAVTGPRYTYVALYIVAMGIDMNFSPIYSFPTFIGVLSLPDPSTGA